MEIESNFSDLERRKKVLVIGTHNDEPEFDAGGLVLRLRQLGWEMRFICTSHMRRYSKKQSSQIEPIYKNPEKMAEYLEQDYAAARVFGVDKVYLRQPDNRFAFFSEEDVLALRDQIEDFEPDIALIHWVRDNHFEHVESAKLEMLALSYTPINCEFYAFEGGPWQIGV